jgi:hypothetical protein
MLRASKAKESRLPCKPHPSSSSANPPSSLRCCSIDSGVDYGHPFLGGGIGPGKKVIGGYDFVGDDYYGTPLSSLQFNLLFIGMLTGSNDPIPDDDPIDNCGGHGTHVAVCLPLSSRFRSSLMPYKGYRRDRQSQRIQYYRSCTRGFSPRLQGIWLPRDCH